MNFTYRHRNLEGIFCDDACHPKFYYHMRGKHFLVSAIFAMALSSCDFEQDFGEAGGKEYGEMEITVKASATDELSSILGGLWKSGDALKMRLDGGLYEDTDDCLNLLSASEGSDGVLFNGAAPSYREGDDAYLYFSTGGEFSSTGYVKNIPSNQSGDIDDVLDNVLYYSWVRRDAIRIVADGKSLGISTNMSPMAAVLKITVPEELQARNVRIKASLPIAGTVTVNPQMGWGSFGENALLNARGQEDVIVIDSENTVSGDVYVVVMPDCFDAASDAYCCSAQTLTFSCDYYEGEFAKRFILNDYMACGTVTDLGTLPMPTPKIPVDGGTIRMMPDASLTIGIADANPDCEYYYELGTNEEDCPTPTASSTKFDPQTGFHPEITGHFDRYYIKVLAYPLDTDYKGVVMQASLRNWKFSKGCPVDAVLSQMESGTLLPKVGDTEVTSHGLELRRNSLKATGNFDIGPYEVNDQRIACTSARIQINAALEYPSDAWIGFYVDKNTCVGSGNKRGYRFFYNNSQSTSDYWSEVINATGSSSQRHNICLHLTDIFAAKGLHVGDKFGLRGDGKHVYYGIALLEVL